MICIKAENLFSIREDARRIPRLHALFPRPVSIIYGIDQRSLVLGRFPKGRNHAIGTRARTGPMILAASPALAIVCGFVWKQRADAIAFDSIFAWNLFRTRGRAHGTKSFEPEPNCGRVKRGWPRLNLEVRGNERVLFCTPERVNNAER
jgi:hypothetical protein